MHALSVAHSKSKRTIVTKRPHDKVAALGCFNNEYGRTEAHNRNPHSSAATVDNFIVCGCLWIEFNLNFTIQSSCRCWCCGCCSCTVCSTHRRTCKKDFFLLDSSHWIFWGDAISRRGLFCPNFGAKSKEALFCPNFVFGLLYWPLIK